MYYYKLFFKLNFSVLFFLLLFYCEKSKTPIGPSIEYGKLEYKITAGEAGIFHETLHKEVKTSTYRKNPLYLLFANLNTLNLQLLALAVCASLNMIDLFLLLFALYYLVRILVINVFYLYQAKARLT